MYDSLNRVTNLIEAKQYIILKKKRKVITHISTNIFAEILPKHQGMRTNPKNMESILFQVNAVVFCNLLKCLFSEILFCFSICCFVIDL